MRYLHLVHTIPGRTRLRYPPLRREPETVDKIADALAAIRGVFEVKVRPYTGSILVLHNKAVTADVLVDEASRVLACDRVLAPGDPTPSVAAPELSRIARLAARTFRELDRAVLAATEGSFDLGTMVTVGFLAVGGAQILVDREIPLPPWFNLAWWSYRTFMTNEQDEIAHEIRASDGA
jgi:hypothetical protein